MNYGIKKVCAGKVLWLVQDYADGELWDADPEQALQGDLPWAARKAELLRKRLGDDAIRPGPLS